MKDKNIVRGHIFVSGVVQGVYYRQFTQSKAKAFGLTGWVKNLPNGMVEVMCEAEKGLILEFIKELKIGPPSANVVGVQVEWKEYTGEFNDFEIKF
ncbi:MAG: acylphosphatase [Candidatus Stahlbacteria bacterium]|nr:acylphosphatase [Candidatus Stahlbacteria bacterium]